VTTEELVQSQLKAADELGREVTYAWEGPPDVNVFEGAVNPLVKNRLVSIVRETGREEK